LSVFSAVLPAGRREHSRQFVPFRSIACKLRNGSEKEEEEGNLNAYLKTSIVAV